MRGYTYYNKHDPTPPARDTTKHQDDDSFFFFFGGPFAWCIFVSLIRLPPLSISQTLSLFEIMGQEPEIDLAMPGKVSAPPGSSAIAVAIPAGNASTSVPMWQQEKQGAKCCGCCCDYRRAVIVLAIINICVSLGYVITALAAASIPGTNMNLDDDEIIAIWEDGVRTQSILAVISLAVSILTLVGALKYNIYLVAIDILWIIGT